jgi:UDP:flavonoid glycosyltransferase YjiC (YdhE family)
MRVLLTWELGLNYGHLTRLLPIAQRLKRDGDGVLVAVRDLHAASVVLGPAGIPFVQAPHLPQGLALDHRAAGYSDILLSQGWADRAALSGLVQGWLNLIRLFRPDKLVLDYSPTVSLAARIARIPTALIGNGFELPPLTNPLPAFPGFSWADPRVAETSERLAVGSANSTLGTYNVSPLTALRDLFTDATRLFVTWPELDHYGPRVDAQYVGPLLGDLRNTSRIDWPEGEGPPIFACVRPDSSHVQVILGALAAIRARVACVAPGFSEQQLAAFRKPHIFFTPNPVDLNGLLDAALCITYGAEGTIVRFLLAGTPQLISPWHVEAFMGARRIQAMGLGLTLEGKPTVQGLVESIERASSDADLSARAKAFAARAAEARTGRSQQAIAEVWRFFQDPFANPAMTPFAMTPTESVA